MDHRSNAAVTLLSVPAVEAADLVVELAGDTAAPTLLPLTPPVDHGAQEASQNTAFASHLSVASMLNLAKMNAVSA